MKILGFEIEKRKVPKELPESEFNEVKFKENTKIFLSIIWAIGMIVWMVKMFIDANL